jgi:hypothetical protein
MTASVRAGARPGASARKPHRSRCDFPHIGLPFDLVIGNAHGFQHGLDDAHPIALGLPRRDPRFLLQQAHHHADRQRIFDRDAADRVDGVEQAGLLDQEQRAPPAIGQSGADADALVFLADPDEARLGCLRQRPQQALAGGDVRHRDDELDPARLDFPDDAGAVERTLRCTNRCAHRCHRRSSPSPVRLTRLWRHSARFRVARQHCGCRRLAGARHSSGEGWSGRHRTGGRNVPHGRGATGAFVIEW